jgi:hypothetical protein
MRFARLHRLCGTIPLIMSGVALALIGVTRLAGLERGSSGDGLVAHVFQLLIVLQAPVLAVFLLTADWRAAGPVWRTLALQIVGIAAAVAPAAAFGL